MRVSNLLSLLVTSLCFATVLGVVDRHVHSNHASKFRKVFGVEQFDTHFKTSAEFTTALEGKQFLLQHFDTTRSTVKENVLQTQIEEDEDGEGEFVSNHVLCTSYVGGKAMREALNTQFGDDQVHPVYQSAMEDSFCFLVALPASLATSPAGIEQQLAMSLSVTSGARVEFVLPQPDVMKIHHSVLDLFLLTPQQAASAVDDADILSQDKITETMTSKKQKKQKKHNDLIASATLSVSLGLGNGRKAINSNSDSVLKQLRSDLMAKHPHEHIQQLMRSTLAVDPLSSSASSSSSTMSASAMGKGLWQNAFEELSSSSGFSYKTSSSSSGSGGGSAKRASSGEVLTAQEEDICFFSKLSFSSGHSNNINIESESDSRTTATSVSSGDAVSITGFDSITSQASTPASCLASLVAFLSSHSSHITDIRYTLPAKALNKYGKSIVQKLTSDQQTPYSDAGLIGTGQVVGVGDSGLDERSCFFSNSDGSLVERSPFYNPTYNLSKRKVIQYIDFANDVDTVNGHGTHVCGTIAGQSLGANTVDNGHAEGAKIAFFDMSVDGYSMEYPIPIDRNMFAPAFNAGAKLHSNSWGAPLNIYDQSVLSVDSYHLEEDQFLALFAAGNDGSEGYYSVGIPAVSKNAMAVGASKSAYSTGASFNGPYDEVVYFSSLGPSFDKRIKPDVIAPGSYIESASASGSTSTSCNTVSFQGTSMATPAVAGVGAQIRQYFEDAQFWAATCRQTAMYPRCTDGAFEPRGATVKAVLIHSGEEMGSYGGAAEPYANLGSPPDYYQGYGLVFLQNVLPFAGIETVLDLFVEELTMSSWEQLQYDVVVTDVTRPVKVTVVWMDPLNSVISEKLLLHDIDVTLQLVGGSDTVYGNNIINDEINNVEQAVVNTPVIGTYKVTITSKTFSENNGMQKASIIITSGGSVTSRTLSNVTAASTAICPQGEQLVTMNLLDRGGDGWPSSTTYEIRDMNTSALFKTGALGSAPSEDFNAPVTFCLPSSAVYSVSLLLPEGNTEDALDVGLEIPQCKVYLSYYQTSATLDMNSDPNLCNPCGDNSATVSMYFADSPLLNHYGWNRGSTYWLTSIQNGDYEDLENEQSQLTGTLLYGYIGWVDQCLSPGSYRLVFESALSDDDDGFSGVYYYQAALVGCDKIGLDDDVWEVLIDDSFYAYPEISEEFQMKITVDNTGSCSVDISRKTDNSPPGSAAAKTASSSSAYLLSAMVVAVALTLLL